MSPHRHHISLILSTPIVRGIARSFVAMMRGALEFVGVTLRQRPEFVTCDGVEVDSCVFEAHVEEGAH